MSVVMLLALDSPMNACSELVDGEEFYKEYISPDTGSVSLTQLCKISGKINTQDLDPCPCKARVPLHCPGCFIFNPYQIRPFFTALRQKASDKIEGKGEIACFFLSAQTNPIIWPSTKLSANGFRLDPSQIFLSDEYLTGLLKN